MAGDAPIDGFGVGTDLVVSADAPALDIAYKLTEYGGEGRVKLSADKRTLPGRKQVFRNFDDDAMTHDVIAHHDETLRGAPLLKQVMKRGVRLASPEPLAETRARCRAEIARLPAALRALAPAEPPYRVEVSPALSTFERDVARRVAES
jgi:nicotinate phosphoribosyltransferase